MFKVTYEYDAAGRLISSTCAGKAKVVYSYDPAGNRLLTRSEVRESAGKGPPAQAAQKEAVPAKVVAAPQVPPPLKKVPKAQPAVSAPLPPPAAAALAPTPPAPVPQAPGGERTMIIEAAPRLPSLYLTIESGDRQGERIILTNRGNLGRATDNDIVLDDPGMSRHHAAFTRGEAGCWVLTDLGSANGTFVNEEKIAGPFTLKPGDIIRVGNTALRVIVQPA